MRWLLFLVFLNVACDKQPLAEVLLPIHYISSPKSPNIQLLKMRHKYIGAHANLKMQFFAPLEVEKLQVAFCTEILDKNSPFCIKPQTFYTTDLEISSPHEGDVFVVAQGCKETGECLKPLILKTFIPKSYNKAVKEIELEIQSHKQKIIQSCQSVEKSMNRYISNDANKSQKHRFFKFLAHGYRKGAGHCYVAAMERYLELVEKAVEYEGLKLPSKGIFVQMNRSSLQSRSVSGALALALAFRKVENPAFVAKSMMNDYKEGSRVNLEKIYKLDHTKKDRDDLEKKLMNELSLLSQAYIKVMEDSHKKHSIEISLQEELDTRVFEIESIEKVILAMEELKLSLKRREHNSWQDEVSRNDLDEINSLLSSLHIDVISGNIKEKILFLQILNEKIKHVHVRKHKFLILLKQASKVSREYQKKRLGLSQMLLEKSKYFIEDKKDIQERYLKLSKPIIFTGESIFKNLELKNSFFDQKNKQRNSWYLDIPLGLSFAYSALLRDSVHTTSLKNLLNTLQNNFNNIKEYLSLIENLRSQKYNKLFDFDEAY